MKFKRINLVLKEEDNKEALQKANNTLGICSLSALVRYLIKKFNGENK